MTSKSRRVRLLLLVTCFFGSSSLSATSARMVNPVAGVRAVNIELSLGGPMHREFNNSGDLFRGSRVRAEAFERRVKESIAKKFAAQGITIDPAAKHTMMFGIWGRPIAEAGCEELSIALIEASFHDERILEEPGYRGESTISWGRSILEVSRDGSIEESLEAAILQLVGEVLERGTGKDD